MPSKHTSQGQKIPSFFPYTLWLEWFYYGFFLGFTGLFVWLLYQSFGVSMEGLVFFIPCALVGLHLLYHWILQWIIFFLKTVRGEKFGVWIEDNTLIVRMSPRKERRLSRQDVKTCERKIFVVSQSLPITQRVWSALILLKDQEVLKISDLQIDNGQWLKAAIDQWKS